MAIITINGKQYQSKSPEEITLGQVMDVFAVVGEKLPAAMAEYQSIFDQKEESNTKNSIEVIKMIPFLIQNGIFYEIGHFLFLDDSGNYLPVESLKLTKLPAVIEALRDFFMGIKEQWSVLKPLFNAAKAEMGKKTDS